MQLRFTLIYYEIYVFFNSDSSSGPLFPIFHGMEAFD